MDNENINEAIKSAKELLYEMEIGELPVERYLMKAKRVARLIGDSDAQVWLNYELIGYPASYIFSGLGKCEKYALMGNRLQQSNNNYYRNSLPEFESMVYTAKISIDSISKYDYSIPIIKDFIVAAATQKVMGEQLLIIEKTKYKYTEYVKIFSSIKSSIHSYITDVLISLKLGNISESIFNESRNLVDEFVRCYCPKAAEQLVSISERIFEGNVESYSQALTSCRRLLLSIADIIFPASDEDYIDKKGKKRKVGIENYKNRILAFFENSKSTSSINIFASELEYLAARLDAVYEKSCKGVHDDIDKREAKLTIISTYIIISEIAHEYKFQKN